ncbi:MAG: ribonuclease P protein component [Nitrososphaera sp.]|nr:ribonuclease P protein component [Nitrososphaera sp.]
MVGRVSCGGAGEKGERDLALKILAVKRMAQESFSRRQRLVHASDYARVFESADAREGNSCWLVLGKRNQTSRARLGLAIGKRCVRRSVQRNRIKRVVRESFRRQEKRLSGWDIVVVARGSVAVCAKAKLVASLEELWHQVRAIYESTL